MNVASVLDDLLARVEKPSRYLGTEVNAIHKDRATVEVRITLVFPDLYDLGLGNLGLHILYAVVNQLPWASCERAYSPGLDMEAALRSRGLPLFALESKDGLSEFDLVGFTLQSELTFTNILCAIELGGIPLHAADRGDEDPLVCAGGPAVFNPEPLVPFIDFFVIGDGEDAILEICEVLRANRGATRSVRLSALARLVGVYVPALYPFETLADGRILPPLDAVPIRKRLTRDLNGATYPVEAVVPFTAQVHDRASLEVLRGCTQGCRFCQAGMTTRPVRERSLENVDRLMDRMLDATGYEEVSLVSLSTCDYSRVRQLVENTVAKARARKVSVSLPSLRLDSFSVELADMVAETRRTGLTVAPEAASPRLRALINKWIPDEGLLDMCEGAFARGWTHVKFYFMIGLPTERDDDILAIADLTRRALGVGRNHRRDARIHLGVSTFVPKPFTPFQWAAQILPRETARRQDILGGALPRGGGVKFGRHEPEETFLEGLVSRSDRRAGALIEAAYRRGARFDAWREHRNMEAWYGAIDDTSFDVEAALGAREVTDRLPWDHLDVFVSKAWLADDWQRAMELKHAQDCRHRKCHHCGVIDADRPLCAEMLRDHVKARPLEKTWERRPLPVVAEPPVAQRLWFRISRTGTARFLSHLEVQSAWHRALRRAGAPLSHSQGFHPHPKVAFSSALPTFEESLGEVMDVSLIRREDAAALARRLSDTVPAGFGVLGVREVPLNAPSAMSLVGGASYGIVFPDLTRAELIAAVDRLVSATSLPLVRTKGKGETVAIDYRPMVSQLVVRDGDASAVDVVLVTVDGKGARPRELVGLLGGDATLARVIRRDTLARVGDEWVPLERFPFEVPVAVAEGVSVE